LREYSEREAPLDSLQLPANLLTDQTAVVDHLPVKLTRSTKFPLPLPASSWWYSYYLRHTTS
jgi:hypothetical protein